MKIAIIAWGSLVSNPRDLPLDGEWQLNGPKLPVEFSRVSKDARLTLVIDNVHGKDVPTRFAMSSRQCLLDAVADLRDREGTVMKCIGYTDISGKRVSVLKHPDHQIAHDRLMPWLKSNDFGFDAVIWTALQSNYQERQQHEFTIGHATAYLKKLPLTPRKNAFDYIQTAPPEVMTPLRLHLLELKLI